ncbi:hypothetical protein GIB67_012621 [Kingdonia uniflora]|uniref:Protein FAR1-RELATED SEQUENCE n=1 Tax=Kingdonia uniflora TaxID=39325 RepID=A0A7J7NFB5_9MAGN|nr:hypothetical protein GIB67_012621 [Kingdonia uniflora]
MEDFVEPEWSKVIGDESPPRAANECMLGVCSGTPDCTIDSLFMETPYEGKFFDIVDDKNKTYDISEQDGKKRSSYQCWCKATLNINWREKLDKFVVTSFSDVHNHKLVSPHNHHRMKINRFFPEAVKNLTKTFEPHNISVFPNTKYRLCLWHIIHKFPKKIGHIYRDPSTFKTDIDSIIHNTYNSAEFDRRWNELMKKHNLDNNNWMQGIFNMRERWIPLWNRGAFYAGMSTTGRSESINNFFNGWLLPSTGLPRRHLFKVFSKYDVLQILDAFILPRWMIGANKYSRSYGESFLDGDILRKPLRHSHILLRAVNLFERASKNKTNFEYTISRLYEFELHLDVYDASLTQLLGSDPLMPTSLTETVMSSAPILDPLVAQTKCHAKDDHKKGGP